MIDTLVISPQQANEALAQGAFIIDMRKAEDYAAGHVPGATNVAYEDIVRSEPPVGGLLPHPAALAKLFGGIGLSEERVVIAYDDDGNGRAGRLLWTLHAAAHNAPTAIMDGGFKAWHECGLDIDLQAPQLAATRYEPALGLNNIADAEWIIEHLDDPDVRFLDTRSPAEYRGEDVRSARGGHIPGAINFNWVLAMDEDRHKALRPREELLAELAALGITPDKEVMTYCQTHQRSSHTFVVLKWLGFEKVRGYPGAWSEWGNAKQAPINTGSEP